MDNNTKNTKNDEVFDVVESSEQTDSEAETMLLKMKTEELDYFQVVPINDYVLIRNPILNTDILGDDVVENMNKLSPKKRQSLLKEFDKLFHKIEILKAGSGCRIFTEGDLGISSQEALRGIHVGEFMIVRESQFFGKW